MVYDEAFGVEEKFFKVCEGLFSGVEMRVLMNRAKSRWFGVERGFRQGFPFFPLMFNIYMMTMVEELETAHLKIKDSWCGALIYEDGIVQVMYSGMDLQTCWRLFKHM